MGIFFLNSCLPGMWQVPGVGNRRMFLTIIPGTNNSSYYCTGCEPVTVPPFLLNSHNTLKVDTYYVYSTNEATNSEVKRLAQVTPLRFKPRPHWASKIYLTTSHHFVQCLCDLGFKLNCRFLFLVASEAQTLKNSFEATAPLRCHNSGVLPWSMNICKTLLRFLLV